MEISLRDQPSQLPISSDDDQPSQLPVPDSVPLPSVHYQQSFDPVSSDDLSLPRANHNKASLPVLVPGPFLTNLCTFKLAFLPPVYCFFFLLFLLGAVFEMSPRGFFPLRYAFLDMAIDSRIPLRISFE
ncbi:hypothetical protein Q3G72_000819 [Acer saccharum]|nr:hypothetical protein Q3G72_000819 [Acer saccharum]